MMVREVRLVGIGIITLLHVWFLSNYVSSENQPSRPSSCGDIRNISSPFRLKGDPPGCGDPHLAYELVCENNRTILYGKYYVEEINYHNSTIRVVVPGLEKGNCFSTPLYSLILRGLYPYQAPYEHNTIVLMTCTRAINDHNHIPITSCEGSNNNVSSSQAYTYALIGRGKVARDIQSSCTMGTTVVTGKFKAVSEPRKSTSMSDLQEILLMGLELSFLYFRCGKCKGGLNVCEPNFNDSSIICHKYGTGGRNWLRKLKDDVLVPMINFFPRAFFRIPFTWEGLRKYLNDGDYPSVGVVIVITIIGGRTVLGMLCLFSYLIFKFHRRHLSSDEDIEEFLQNHKNFRPIRYSYSHLKKMTNNFKNKLGQGGFGSVYKGKLRSGQIVAVKMLVISKANGQDFINEVATIGRIHHINVVRLVGFCVDGSKWALIYDFMLNGSLDKFIFLKGERSIPLSWERLYKIALGVGRGIEYLHQGCDMQILHFDIKPHNILLDEDFTPKVSNFGLAKLYSIDESIVSLTAARGTLGYIAPELFYKNIGHVSYKANVYSFGMLLMEMVGKRRHVSAHEENLSEIFFPSWIYDQIEQGGDMEMGDATEDEKKYMRKMIIVALWCVQMKPIDRPSMSKALNMLESDVEILQMPPKPTLYSHEMSTQDQQNNPMGDLISSCNASMTISLDGR
ncbi:hypothetical protein PVL29_021530 [Vitis rotundifolia]|uniref:Protein kinase domain-containing protein n=1 Tax=Vitis rotundifolia TaxID=103349 RepID=A0AA39DD35_VITRO|nr:hypothetical protein PVL29_021530 [Vitis rotundifolia]